MALADLVFAVSLASAAAWMGAALYQARITDPVIRDAGAAGLGWAQAHARRFGTGMFFAALAATTVLLTLASYLVARAYETPFSGSALWLGLATLAAVLALGRGATANRVAEGNWIKAVKRGATEDMASLNAKAARANVPTLAAVAIAVVFLVASRAFA